MTAAMAAISLAVLLTGCDTDDGNDTSATGNLLREYQPRYEAVRGVLDGFASRVPEASPTAPVCDRQVAPAFDLAGGARLGDPGNTELVMADQLATPEEALRAEASPADYTRFSVTPGYLTHGLGVSRLSSSMSPGELANFLGYSGSAAMVNAQDQPTRLKLLLDAGLGVRYLVAVRTVRYEPATPRPSGSVTVDAYVLDLAKGDIPCRFQATGASPGVMVYEQSRPGDLTQLVYEDIQNHLGIAVDDVLTRFNGQR
ncbi:hypothetical protein M8542_47805 [Amycolatopsis sp. OK19-0408]|uniref:Uncharacterized protein n=1 Tax=Amycolatopsis iheyensis TaxID=2945988 RepID=A0A9X2NP81_9PSEU|nr:hypothetical protein [Amycolatopsis iheyensis]MCR6490534.1 hypothetical protein [Amycolatopsis iheyensis]